jgi:hypothetical protein
MTRFGIDNLVYLAWLLLIATLVICFGPTATGAAVGLCAAFLAIPLTVACVIAGKAVVLRFRSSEGVPGVDPSPWYSDAHETLADRKYADGRAMELAPEHETMHVPDYTDDDDESGWEYDEDGYPRAS